MFLLRCCFALLATICPIFATSSTPFRCPFNQAPRKNGSCASVAGGSCDAQHLCIDGATCNTTYNLCFCDSNRAEQMDTGLCVVPAGGNCTCDSDCDRTLSCEDGKCQCPFGTTNYPNFKIIAYDEITNNEVYKYISVCLITAGQRCEPNGFDYTVSTCTYSACDPNSERCTCQHDSTWNPATKTCDCIGASYHTTTAGTDCEPYVNANAYTGPDYAILYFCNDQTFQNDITHSCDCLGASYFGGSDCTPYDGAIQMNVNGTSLWECPPGSTADNSEFICQCDDTVILEGDTLPSCDCSGASYSFYLYCQMYTNAIGGFENQSWVWSCPAGSIADANSETCDCLYASYFANTNDVTCTPYYGAINVTINGTATWTCPEGVITSDTDLSCGCFGASYSEEGNDFCTPYDNAQQGWFDNYYGYVCPDGFVTNDTDHSCNCMGATFLVTVDGYEPYGYCEAYANALGTYLNGVDTYTCPPGSVANTTSHTCNCLGYGYFATATDSFCTNATTA